MFEIQIDNLDLEQVAASGQCFRWKKLDENKYFIPMVNEAVEVVQNSNMFEFSCSEDEFNNIWRYYLDIDTDYGQLITQIDENDTFLSEAAMYGSGIRILNQNFWEMMISFIISQNNNIPRITGCLNSLCERFGGFPDCNTLKNCSVEDLAGLGLGYRDEYIICAANYYDEASTVNNLCTMTYDDAMKELMSIKGIGRKVANCICLFGLHMLEACPIDVWMKKIIDEDYRGNMPDWMKSDMAGVYQQYVFYYKRSKR